MVAQAIPSASVSSTSLHHAHPHPHPHHHHPSHPTQHRHPTTSNHSSSKRPPRPAIKRVSSASSTKGKRVSIEIEPRDEFDDMAASFPQFCTVCENQIVTPSNLMLYCSENCRRRDTNKPLSPSLSESQSPPSTPILSNSEDPTQPRDIIAPRTPTAISGHRFSYISASSASSDNEVEQDSAEDSRDVRRSSLHHRRQHSEAARYLRQFQSPAFIAEVASRPSRRPKPTSRSSTASLAPSLTHSSSPSTSPTTPLSSLPYSRPLPPRTNPYSNSFAAKSFNLVTPFAGAQSMPPPNVANSSLAGLKSRPSVSTDVGANELPDQIPAEELKYEKKDMTDRTGSLGSPGNLRAMFRFNEMQAPPSK